MRGTQRAPSFESLKIVWWAIFGSVVIFLVVLQLVERPAAMAQPQMLPILALVALSSLGLGLIFPGRMFRAALVAKNFDVVERADPTQPEGFGAKVKVPREPESAKRELLAAYTTKTILGSALGESVSLFGLVAGISGAELIWVIPFFVAGASVQAFHYPRPSAMAREATSATGIRFET